MKDKKTGAITMKSSDVMGYSFYFEAGPRISLYREAGIWLGSALGYRYSEVYRTVFKCNECKKQTLDGFNRSFYIRSFIEYRFSNIIRGQLYFSYYFEQTGFSQSLGIQFSFFAL
ncbi:MAG: hypothetical protein HRU20_07035 [Pseudomonadales bacterium]|nr:hypothetical protein [Pseudomonadales bacterium]